MQEKLIELEKAIHASGIDYKDAVRLFKRQLICAAIDRNVSMKDAAKELGITPQAMNANLRLCAEIILGQARG